MSAIQQDASKTPPTSDADRRRHKVVQKAARLFDKNGYHNTSMDDIAAAVDLRKPSLYHYFESKEEILFWIHQEFIDLIIDRQVEREGVGLPPEERLLEVMADVLELMHTHRGHVRVFFEHHRELPARYQKTIRPKRDFYQQNVEAIVVEGMESGAFRKIDPRLATLALFGMCNWAYQWYQSRGEKSSREIAGIFAELYLNGIRTESETGS